MQLGTILSTFVRHMELRIDAVPEHNYHVRISSLLRPLFDRY